MSDLTVCPNRDCRLVYRPDERVYPGSSERCPKCGTDFAQATKEREERRKDDAGIDRGYL